jgi:lysophospholipase L1-like esterase
MRHVAKMKELKDKPENVKSHEDCEMDMRQLRLCFGRGLCSLVVSVIFATVVDPAAVRAEVCSAQPEGLEIIRPKPPQPTNPPSLITDIERQAQEGSFSALTFGDSIMARWPRDLLASAFDGTVLDAALGGGTDTLLWELSAFDWSRQSPRFVLILVGTNNIGHGGCAVYWGIRADVAAIRQMFPGGRIIVISILPRGSDLRFRERDIEVANANLKEAAANAGYEFLDAHDQFLCEHRTPCDLLDQTNLHPTRAGYEVLSPLLRKLLLHARP